MTALLFLSVCRSSADTTISILEEQVKLKRYVFLGHIACLRPSRPVVATPTGIGRTAPCLSPSYLLVLRRTSSRNSSKM